MLSSIIEKILTRKTKMNNNNNNNNNDNNWCTWNYAKNTIDITGGIENLKKSLVSMNIELRQMI